MPLLQICFKESLIIQRNLLCMWRGVISSRAGHEAIELNEKADQAAKEAAENPTDALILPTSLGGLLRRTKTLFHKREAVYIKPYKTKMKWIAEALNNLEKGQAAIIFQLRCGHCPLKKFLHRIGVEDNNKCTTCFATETPTHYLIFCRKFTKQRQAFRRRLKEEEIKVNTNSATILLDTPRIYPFLAQYILDTGRFPHLQTYIEN